MNSKHDSRYKGVMYKPYTKEEKKIIDREILKLMVEIKRSFKG